MVKKEALILLGAPGSGKGTQGIFLERKTQYKTYIMSSLIKKELKIGKKSWAKKYDVESGLLLNDLNIFELFRENFSGEEGIILDGIPRTIDQAYWLYGFLTEHKYDIKVIFLNCNEKKLLDRILIRAQKEGRKDDSPEIFRDRLKIYDRVKEVILQVYSEQIIDINGDQSIEDVTEEINNKLNI